MIVTKEKYNEADLQPVAVLGSTFLKDWGREQQPCPSDSPLLFKRQQYKQLPVILAFLQINYLNPSGHS